MILMRLRRWKWRLSYLTSSLHDHRPGMQGWMPLAESVAEPIGVVAAVAEQPLRFWQVVQQRCRAGVVTDLPGGHEEAQTGARSRRRQHGAWCSCRLWCGRSGGQDPFLIRRLEAVRRAFR
jgi:hypothetical protein